jgi:putative FmdB family regulatory protein
MPIYEYSCQACGKSQSILFLSQKDAATKPRCKYCGARRLKRLLSRVAYHQTEASRLNDLDTSAPRDESFYRDSRNVGLWAKKRAKQMGVDLGSQFEETVEKARSGKIIDDLDDL